MESSNVYFLVLSLIISSTMPKFVSAQSPFRRQWCSNTTYAPNSTYQSNLQELKYSDFRITCGFYNMTAGHEPDKVSSLALCRGDVPVNTCGNCIMNSVNFLIDDVCPNQMEGFGYSEYCSVFFSNRSIYGKVQNVVDPWFYADRPPITNTRGFSDALSLLMQSLKNRAGSGNSEMKYAADKANTSGGQSLYGLVQCTPDLSKKRCMQCIQKLIDYFPSCCVQSNYTASGVMLVLPNCFVRYDINSFYGDVSDDTLQSLPTLSPDISPSDNATTSGRKSNKTRIVGIVSIALGVSTMLLATSIIFSILLKKRKLRKTWMVKFSKDEIEDLRSLQFSLGAMQQATQNFSEDYKLGEGGFGSVYKGVLPDGQEIAVKKLVTNSRQGDAEFKNEVLILAKLQHRNLVRLLGFCLHGKEMIIVYELVANRSLDKFIFDPLSRQSMQWETRYKIIKGVARGILYLHENSRLKIVHRDLKAANILLDEDFYPKIADFGLARLFNFDQSQTQASKIVGTLGYISPEYAHQHQVSVKLDVYSFGVLVLEIVSGQRITSFLYDEENQETLLSFAWRNWTEGNASNLVDPVIQPGSSIEILRCIHIGLLCVQDDPADRPTMSAVDLMLSSDFVTLQVPAQPAFYTEGQNLPDMLLKWSTTTKSSVRSEGRSINNVSITELHPR